MVAAPAHPAPGCRQLPLWNEPVAAATVEYFIVLPDAQLASFARRPLAIGLQLAVIRLCMRAGASVPASRADLVAWADDCATRDDGLGSRLKRAIDDLRACGLLDGVAEPGAKLWLQPGWGHGRDGRTQVWNWKRRDRGRPAKLSFRKILIGLLDDYLGVCYPDARDPAQVERWFRRPLLGLEDIGAYALRCAGIRVASVFLLRLRHLGLLDERDQPLPPRPRAELLERAAAGELTTLSDDGQVVTVRLSPLGEHALGRREAATLDGAPSSCGEGGSLCGPKGGSREAHSDPAPPCAEPSLEGAPFAAGNRVQRATESNPPSQPEKIMAEEVVVLLDPMIQAGHRLINGDRDISNAEWLGLLALQQECGVNRILTWQARAAEAGRTQVVPAYYRQCAAAAALGAVRPTPPPAEAAAVPISAPTLLAPPMPTRPALDADQQAALRELEQAAGERVRAPWRLAGTPAACIRAWAGCIGHAGLVAYCRLPPLHYAVDQMALCLPPPSAAQLTRWAAAVTPGAARAEGQRAGGARWSDTTISELVGAGGGLFTLGSEADDDLAVRPSEVAPAALAADPPRDAPAAPAAPSAAPAAPSAEPPLAVPTQGFERPPAGQDGDQRRWSCALGVLQQELPRQVYGTWVRGAEWGGLAGDVATIIAGRADQADGLRRLAPALERVLVGVLGQPVQVEIEERPARLTPGVTLGSEPVIKQVEDPNTLWSGICGDLQRRLDPATYRTWIRGATLIALTSDTATVQARSAHQRDRLERCEGALIGECLSARVGRPLQVVITLSADVPEELVSLPPASPRAPAAPTPAQPSDPGPASTPAAGPPADDPARPSWIPLALWPTVPTTLRVALVGARLEAGRVVARSGFFQSVVERHAEQVRELLNDEGGAA